ncbi:MAG: phosphate acyltransferase PlsX [Clostridia bacterium]|jgi:glycerol-3-phosphate acyltransferase PlsX|nr:phosphate acyltransferase PlsX [Clostridia bacterium]
MTKIIVDAMGGDNAPSATVAGCVEALKDDKNLYLILTGRQNEIEAELKKYTYDKTRLEIVDCPDVIDMNDIPTEAIKRKQSSLIAAYWMLKKEDDICALVTAGSTGATIVGGQLILGRIRGVKRPALCPAIPNSRGSFTLLCDCGANAECKPVMLCQFALLASAYAEVGFGIKNPKVGLLSNGTEEHKGDPLHQQTYKYLTEMQGINFTGNIEGRDIMTSQCDVAVADGFSGNVALKSMEGCGKLVLGVMKKEFSATLSSKIGYLFMRKAIKRMRFQLDFNRYGGALLLGLKKVVVKSHGSSKPQTIAASIANAAAIHRNGLVPAVEKKLESVDFNSLIQEEE